MTTVSASFDIAGWDEHAFDVHAGTAKLTRAKVDKTYTGDLTGTSVTEWLMAYAADGNATFVGLERIDATVAGRSGTVVLRHVGAFADGAAKAELTVVAGAGSGDLATATGSGDLLADPAGKITLELTFS
jgi:hypothetical protein